MLFTTPLFLFVFLPLFLAAYYLVPNNITIKNAIALLGSVVFFAWGEPIFVFCLLIGTYIDYQISLYITPEYQATGNQTRSKILLILAISFNVLLLLTSKYLNFFCETFSLSLPNLPLILGISFITFHKISYLVDSYQGRAIPPRHFFDCALYIFLFPQLIAGPIIRYHDIGSEIHQRAHSVELFLSGFLRFSTGLIKKLLIADSLAVLADKVFDLPTAHLSPLFAWGGIVAYTLQIYFDFSGYSDMAIGLGRMIGFHFPENFNRPYTAKSITEFWQRWHISLSNWMRLYLYIPLGGNRVSVPRTYLNLWIVFLISGFWHGASWNFLAWGAYYGLFLSLERVFKINTLPGWIQQMLTLLIVMVGWVFFRSPTLDYAVNYIATMFCIQTGDAGLILPWGIIFNRHALAILMIALPLATVKMPPSFFQHAITNTISLQFLLALSMLIIASAAMMSSDYTPFLYFRF